MNKLLLSFAIVLTLCTPCFGEWKYNPLKDQDPSLDYYWGVDSIDDYFLKLDQTTPQTTIGTFSFPEVRQTSSGSVTRNADNYITAKTITGGKTYTYTRNADNYVTDFTDGTLTWTLTRNADGYITSWTVS